MIVYSNMMVALKPKGMMMYKWCCYHPLINSTKGFLMKGSKSMEVGRSQRVVWYRVVQKIACPVVDHYLHNPQPKTLHF